MIADTITDEIAEDIIRTIGAHWNITSVERTARRLTIHRSMRLSTSTLRAALDAEDCLVRKYGNHPYTMSQDVTLYRATFTCN